MKWIGSLASMTLIVIAGCFDPELPANSSADSGTDSSEAAETSGGEDQAGSSGATSAEASTTGQNSDESSTGEVPDEGTAGEVFACDPFSAGDCEPGLKCQPWATPDGGGCVPEGPDDVESPCSIGEDGVDSCIGGAYCLPIDDVGTLTCVPLCGGTPAQPTCSDVARTCAEVDQVPVCLPACDPVLQDCLAGQGCYPSGVEFACSAAGAGEPGGPCDESNSCALGLLCVGGESCGEFCDLDGPNECECTPYFEEGAAPPGLDHVGVCA